MLQGKEKLEIIVPVYNEESCIDELFRRLTGLRKKMTDVEVGFIFVNDGSKDGSLEVLLKHAEGHDFVKVVSFSRNFGHQMAATAGLDYADANYVVIIDADLQDPPELIPTMFKKAKEGFDIVYGKRIQRKGETIFKKWTAKMFYKIMSKLCDVEIPTDTGDFRLINQKVLDALRKMRERHRFIRGMVPWVGFKSTPLLYQRDARFAGETKYPLKKMMKFALDAIFSFSNTPLRIATYSGGFIVGLGVMGALLILYLRLFTTYTVPGISAVIMAIIIMGGFQIVMLGIIGEYVGRIFEESKNRPLYIVSQTKNIIGTTPPI